jgi:FAD:protein FMN transferase
VREEASRAGNGTGALTLAAALVLSTVHLACLGRATAPPTGASRTGPRDAPVPALQRYEFTQPHMGTTFRIVLYADDRARAERASEAAFARIAELDRRLSDYRADSELMVASREAAAQPVVLGPDLFRVLHTAHVLAERTGGAFDVTAGALTRAWRRTRRLGEVPSETELAAARAVTGYRLMDLDAGARTLRLARQGMGLDVGGIGKGYAADAALVTLRAHDTPRAMVAAGGDVRAGKAPPGERGWRVALAPLGSDRHTAAVVLADAAISTSGDAEQWVEIGGVRYSHMIDPRSGWPLTGRRSVTVVARDATTSDMLATAAGVLGPQEGARLVEEHGASLLFGLEAGGRIEWTVSSEWPGPGLEDECRMRETGRRVAMPGRAVASHGS